MDGAWVCPSIAMAMMAEGTEQIIRLDHRTILKKVMQSLGAPEEPMYTTYNCASNCWRVSVRLNISTVKNYVGQKLHSVEVEGEALPSKMAAEESAVMKALQHLKSKHFVKISDFSSRVARELDGSNAFRNVNGGVYNVDRILGKWEVVIDKCEQISVELARKVQVSMVSDDGGVQGGIYASLRDSLQMLVAIYKPKMNEATNKTGHIEAARKEYHDGCTAQYHAELSEGHLQQVCLSAKDVLGFVLTYIGAGKATYSNWPNAGTMTEGVVQFNIPYEKGLETCGNVNISGKSTGSRESEENAAYNALVYMEKTYKLKIVDLNHEERTKAEKDQKMLLDLMEQLATVSKEVKHCWREIIESITRDKREFISASANMCDGTIVHRKFEAYNFCISCLQEVEEEATNGYNDCAFRFEENTKMLYALEDLKAMLDME